MNEVVDSDDGTECGNPFNGEDDDEIEDCASEASDTCSETSCHNNGSIVSDEVQAPVETKQKFFSRYNPKKVSILCS